MSAKTQLLGGDLLACVMGGVYTDVEKTMIEHHVGPDMDIELFVLAPESRRRGLDVPSSVGAGGHAS